MSMSTHKWKICLMVLSGAFLLLCAVGAAVLLSEVEYRRFSSPDHHYTAIVTYRRYQSFLPTLPGQSSDKEGSIRIVDSSGTNYGKIAIPMVWMAEELEWTARGAELGIVGRWDFFKREYRYWNEDQTREIVKSLK